jgi:TolA-binding protein
VILKRICLWSFCRRGDTATNEYKSIELGLFAPRWAGRLAEGINQVLAEQHRIRKNQETIMATLDDLVAAASAEDTKIDSLIALVEALKAKVDAIPGLTAEQQAQIDAAFASISDNPDRIQAAIDANTAA